MYLGEEEKKRKRYDDQCNRQDICSREREKRMDDNQIELDEHV